MSKSYDLGLLKIFPSPEEIFHKISTFKYSVICGNNNTGKSVLLQLLEHMHGKTAYYVGVQRFYQINALNSQSARNFQNDPRENFGNFKLYQTNFDNNLTELTTVVANLSDAARNSLFSLAGNILEATFELVKLPPYNEFSDRTINMDGASFNLASTGTRLIFTILAIAMMEKYDQILIDEPELGLSPIMQTRLRELLEAGELRDKYFPHIKSIIIATHSHIFLNRTNIEQNFSVNKVANTINVKATTTPADFNDLQFRLLGNKLEDLYLPSAFIIVEGKTDLPFIKKSINIALPKTNVVVIEGQGDIKRSLISLITTLGDKNTNPYTNRIFAVLDSVYSPGTIDVLKNHGIKKENIIVWKKNGIEYVYPPEIISQIFECREDDIPSISIDEDNVTYKQKSLRKVILCNDVIGAMSDKTRFNKELLEKLIIPIALATDSEMTI